MSLVQKTEAKVYASLVNTCPMSLDVSSFFSCHTRTHNMSTMMSGSSFSCAIKYV